MIEEALYIIRVNPGKYPELEFLADMPTTTAEDWIAAAVREYDEVFPYRNSTILRQCLLMKNYRKVKKKYVRAALPLDEHFYDEVFGIVEVV